MGWVEVVGYGFDGLIQVILVEVVGCSWIMDRVWDWVLIWIEILGWASMAWFRWEVSHSDCVVFVVVVERWKSQVGGGWIVGFIFVLFVCFVFCVCMCVCVCVCGGCQLKSGERGRLFGAWKFFFSYYRGLWLSLMGQQWKWYCCCIMMVWFLWLMFISILMSYLYYFKWIAKIINFLL